MADAIGHDDPLVVSPQPSDEGVCVDLAAKADVAQHAPRLWVLWQTHEPLEDLGAEEKAVLLVEPAEMGRSPKMVFLLQEIAGSHNKVGPRPLGRGPEHVSP